MTTRLAPAFVTLALSACADAQDPPSITGDPPPSVVVADGREAGPELADPDRATWGASPAVQAAVGAARAHWSALDPGYEEEVRVLAVADGAFTRAGASEHAVLYLVALWPRCCPKVGVAVVEGGPDGRLARHAAFEGPTHALRAVPDLDGDGADELALFSAFGTGGSEERSVQLASVGPDGLRPWGWAALYSGACGALRDGEEAFRVVATPVAGGPPAFVAERHVRARCEGGAWAPDGVPEPLTLTPSEPSPYTALAVE